MNLRQHTANQYRNIRKILRSDNSLTTDLGRPTHTNKILAYIICILIILMAICLFTGCSVASEPVYEIKYAGYTLNQWANSIRHAEGNDNYGILSIKCTKGEGCRRICKNTVRNNYNRWVRSKSTLSYVRFLGERYAPARISNDPTGLNRFWINNVGFWLRKG